MRRLVLLASLASLALTATVLAQGLTNREIVNLIIKQSREAYYATGHPCACPYDHASNGSACGGRSAYAKRAGGEPKCFPGDVTRAEIAAYRASHR